MTSIPFQASSRSIGTMPPLRLVIAGSAPDTGNAGVTALAESLLDGIFERDPLADVTLFDHGRGHRLMTHDGGEEPHAVHHVGAFFSRRVYRPESWWTIRTASLLGGVCNPAARAIARADAILDVSGGDSFTDLYGPKRFQSIMMPKRMAMQMNRPLILLPQTYGPYRASACRDTAWEVLRASHQAWARDPLSFDVMRLILGDDYDPKRHREGVDLAFLLRPRRPDASVRGMMTSWLDTPATSRFALNISGLLYNTPGVDRAHYGFRSSYVAVVQKVIERILEDSAIHLLLVPHVSATSNPASDDHHACLAAVNALRPAHRERLTIVPPGLGPRELKWIIGHAGWFCGSRMHSTIAALSSLVPTIAIVYSDKAHGVFESCGVGEWIADPRDADASELIHRIGRSIEQRAEIGSTLRRRLPRVRDTANAQLDAIIETCRQGTMWRGRRAA